MESNKIFSKIKELGHVQSSTEDLQKFVISKFDQIIKYLPRHIMSSDGADLLDCIFNALPDTSGTSNYKVKVVEVVLHIMRKESTSLTHCGDVSSRLCLEIPRLHVNDLVRWCNDSVQSIVEDTDINMIWRDVLPECMNALSSYDNVKHCGTEMTSSEYKAQCVHTLCQCSWKERQLVQLTAMFKDMQLPRNEHKQVVNKICSYIIDIPPDTLPPLVHQLLRLCKTYNLEIVLSHLSHYFSVRLYNKLEPPQQDSESTTIDIDDIVPHSPAELSRCLSTCIYHISQGPADPQLVRKHIKLWPKTQLLRSPFLIDLALAVSTKGADFRTVCLDVIKSAIEQRALDDLRACASEWVRSVMPAEVDVVTLLKLITTESANHRQLTVIGLIDLAFLLLSTSRPKEVAPTCWSHGKLILVRLSKSQPEYAKHILSQLSDRLAGDATQKQYSDCLYVLCKLTPVSVENCTELSIILENCQPTPTDFRSAAAIFDAVHPLLNFSTRTRDTLVMVCRKRLYSRDSQHRCLALAGFLTVLSHVRINATSSGSSQQYSEPHSAHSYLTQLTVDLHATQQGNTVTSRVRNETMCMEVVSILRRCFVQDALVKQLLYTRLYECAKDKQSLHENILELLYEHLCKYLPEGNVGTQLLMDKCVQINATGAVLIEPIARLIYAIAQFLQPCEEEDLEDILASQSVETASAHLKSRLSMFMDQLSSSENFGNIDMEDLGLSDITPESKAKFLKVQQIIQCYESLIAHQILQWNKNSTNAALKTLKLFKACNGLIEQTKVPSKSAKKSNKTLNESKETSNSPQKSQKSQKSQKDKGKGPVKLSNLVKDKAGPFKQLPCVWDLKLCVRVMELLYSEELPWSSLEQYNQIRVRRDFHGWALRCIQSVLSEHVDKKYVATHCVSIASVLYNRCICRFQAMCDFDDPTTLLCLEVFKSCLALLFSPNYGLKPDRYLSTIVYSTEPSAQAYVAKMLSSIHSALQYIEETMHEEQEAITKKQLTMLIQIAILLLEVPVASCPTMTEMIVMYEDYIRNSKQECLALIGAVLTAGERDQQESQMIEDILVKLAKVLGKIEEEETSLPTQDTTDFVAIDSRTGHTVLTVLCEHLAARAVSVEHLLGRARDLTAAANYAVHVTQQRIEREIAEVYKAVIVQLCQLTKWITECCKLRCTIGLPSDRVLSCAVKLYVLLATLAKQIDVTVAQNVRFERLLKLSGKKLSVVTNDFIAYLEASQQQHNASKVRRETKLIPKLVLEAEQYSRWAILLADKAKLDWKQYFSLGIARDFRIKTVVLEQALNTRDDTNEQRSEDEVHISDAETEIVEEIGNDEQVNEERDEGTKRKRRKVS